MLTEVVIIQQCINMMVRYDDDANFIRVYLDGCRFIDASFPLGEGKRKCTHVSLDIESRVLSSETDQSSA